MKNTIAEFLTHPMFISGLIALLMSQIMKFLLTSVKRRKVMIDVLYKDYGGMPSTHTAWLSAISTSILFIEGVSTLFMFSGAMLAMTIVNVIGERWFIGGTITVVNKMMSLLMLRQRKSVRRLETQVGHTLSQVFIGFLIGIGSAWVVWQYLG